MPIPPEFREAIANLAADERSGATSIVLRATDVLRTAVIKGEPLQEIAAALVQAQPAMAGLRTAAAVAVSAADPAQALDALAQRIRRTPAAIARLAVPIIRLRTDSRERLRVVTISRSEIVERTLLALAAAEPIVVCCAESEPGREGVSLAEALASQAVDVELYRDAAIGTAVPDAHAVLVGADAISVKGFINKVGTAALVAVARLYGVPAFVLAGREKILPPDEFEALPLRDSGHPPTPSARFARPDPWFERVPAGAGAQLITDAGAVAPEDVEAASLRAIAGVPKYE